jgi:glycosyltransferase involved in cell wall biosynthesis
VKFSVLLPTRNRLEYLKYAIESVRRQDYGDWEIIVSDNFSEDDIAGFVSSLGEDRARYFRTSEFVSVTTNWNNALSNAVGDYMVMLGDDDCLMPQYFSRMLKLIESHGQPELIYTSGYLYAYPGVLEGHADGLLQRFDNATFLRGATGPTWLKKKDALHLVKQSMAFRSSFAYNMQYLLVSRRLLGKMTAAGEVFQSPFPDFYATNAMFLLADRVLTDPRPFVAIGITPKSYGFYYFNNREQEGVDFLNSLAIPSGRDALARVLLPGPNMNTSWFLAVETLNTNFGRQFGLRVNRNRYRMLQILHCYRSYYGKDGLAQKDLQELQRRMYPWERVVYGGGASVAWWVMRHLPEGGRARFKRMLGGVARKLRRSNEWKPAESSRRFSNILEVFEDAAHPEVA